MPSLSRRTLRTKAKKRRSRKNRYQNAHRHKPAPIKRYILSDKPLDYDEYLRSPYWRKLRVEVPATRSRCEECGMVYNLNRHHRYYYKDGKSVLYRERQYPDVFTVLCYPCHKALHGH